MKEVIDSLFFRPDQQQEIMDRYDNMEADLARDIARNRHMEENSREICTSASPFVRFVQGKYDNLRSRLKDESHRSMTFREELGKFQAKLQDQTCEIKD